MVGIEWIVVYLTLGLFVGFMAGLLGIGGGIVMVPALTAIFLAQGAGMEDVVHFALGTSMSAIIVTSFASMRAHNAKEGVVWDIVKAIAPGIILGTFITTFVVAYLKSIHLALFFSLFTAYVSVQMIIDKKPKPTCQIAGKKGLFFGGSIIGSISALVSIGGGSLSVPYLVWQNIDLKKAIGTSAAIGLPLSITGTVGYIIAGWDHTSIEQFQLGFVYLPAVLAISVTSYFMAPYGAKCAHILPVSILKKIFALLLMILSMKMVSSIL